MEGLLDQVNRYLRLVASFSADGAAFAGLLHPDFVQIELPNALNKNGQQSNFEQVLARLQTARQILTAQQFAIENHCADERQVFVEAVWTGQMAVDAGPFKQGQSLRATFCMAFEFRDGRIYRQRNYDCFDPF